MQDERKVVTVLFADTVGSTVLGEQLDPEELTTIMRAFFDQMRLAVEGEGGAVEKYIGDAVVAVFGVPAAHEDDPTRALRCGLDMLRRMEQLNERLQRAHRVQFGLRVGINTGEVLVSNEPDADLGTVTGDAVNVAARLEQAAEPGQVVVSERTARAARGFRFSEVAPLELRGKAVPVRACRLLASQTIAAPGSPERGIPGLTAPMVGREQELALLQAVVRRSAAEGRPNLVTVYGDPGVGKSRLVRELVAWAEEEAEPVQVVRGRCLPYGNGATYWPMAEILKHLAGVLDSDPAPTVLAKLHAMGDDLLADEPEAERARLVGALAATAGIVDPAEPLGDVSPRELRLEMHGAWRTVLSRLALAGPVLAIVEDIHWADPALLDLLEEVADRAVGALVVVCPARPDLVAHRPGWGGGRRNASAIALEPLSLADSSRLASLLLDIDDLPDDVRSRILERAEGNPFFLEEILRQLIDEGHLRREGDRWRAAPSIGELRIPDSVQSVLAARIDLLPAAPKRVLQHAAVVGRVFWTGSLGAVAADSLDEELDVLEGRDLISTRLRSAFRGERECTFRHVLTCSVAYESIPRRDRGDLHAQVAAWLDDVAAGRAGEFAELLAHHWTEAHRGAAADLGASEEEVERRRALAYRWCLAAALESHRRAVAERARSFAQQALELAIAPGDVADAAAALGEAHRLTGDGSPAIAAFRIGADALLAAGAPDPQRAAALCASVAELVARWPGSLIEPYDAGEIREYLDRGLALAGEGDSRDRARLLMVRSFWDWGVRDAGAEQSDELLDERERDARDAVDMADRLGLPDVESGALDALMTCLADQRRHRRYLEISERRLALLPRLHDAMERGDTLCMAASVRFDEGSYDEVVSLASRVEEEVDARYWAALLHALAWRSMALLLLARWDDALADMETASAILRTCGLEQPPPFSSPIWGTSSYVYAARGLIGEAERSLAVLPQQAGPEGDSPSGGASTALTLVRLGRIDAAARRLEVTGRRILFAGALGGLAHLDVAERSGRWEAASALISDRLQTPDPEGPLAPDLACADELAGRQALASGDRETARARLTSALARWSSLGATLPTARVDLALARALVDVDPAAAAVHAESALRVFDPLGSLDEIDLAHRLLAD